ncbi:uncharacterized protein EI97DRAFT_126343 [Westerdykella ornata]|uniref:Uncharacterized protein n=1 Tax=Westerdykella ornata TaxID=318751 RepID=A0A6A6JCI4_WESOR|nr:uncharacterized protein EI97DRAFT_126343 [Westerdykella ornata]KAF2274330.1 hypothetical protein EI97DRAFT_126343 [Westerdykella ornata]
MPHRAPRRPQPPPSFCSDLPLFHIPLRPARTPLRPNPHIHPLPIPIAIPILQRQQPHPCQSLPQRLHTLRRRIRPMMRRPRKQDPRLGTPPLELSILMTSSLVRRSRRRRRISLPLIRSVTRRRSSSPASIHLRVPQPQIRPILTPRVQQRPLGKRLPAQQRLLPTLGRLHETWRQGRVRRFPTADPMRLRIDPGNGE